MNKIYSAQYIKIIIQLFIFAHFLSYKCYAQNNYATNNNEELTNIQNPEIVIMPLGDSITKGTDSSDLSGYRRKLYLDLLHSGQKINFVGTKSRGTLFDFDKDHEGHGSFCADLPDQDLSLLSNISNWLDLNQPDILLLHIGTNDIGRGESSDHVKNEINEILNEIDSWEQNNSKEITVFLAQIIKIVSANNTKAIRISDLNAKLEILANQRNSDGDNIVLVNLETALNYVDDMTEDGYHPNDLGYEKLADVWYESLMDYFPKVNIKVLLEGYMAENQQQSMAVNVINHLPNEQPYSLFNYNGAELIPILDLLPENGIPDFVENHNIADWIYVELRTSISPESQVYKRAVTLNSDGYVIEMNGEVGVRFGGLVTGEYYLVVHHRNHLPIMSSTPILIQ